MGLGDSGGIPHVGLAHLEEAATLAEERQPSIHELPGEGVEHDVRAVGGLAPLATGRAAREATIMAAVSRVRARRGR